MDQFTYPVESSNLFMPHGSHIRVNYKDHSYLHKILLKCFHISVFHSSETIMPCIVILDARSEQNSSRKSIQIIPTKQHHSIKSDHHFF